MANLTMTAEEWAQRTGQTIEEALQDLHERDDAGATVAINAATLGGKTQYDIADTIVPDGAGGFLA